MAIQDDKITSQQLPRLCLRLFAAAAIAGALISVLAAAQPNVSVVISYFWPLLLSTAILLISVGLVMWLSPLPSWGDSAAAMATGEEILEFVTRPATSGHLAA